MGLINGIGIVLLRIPPLVMTLGMTGVVSGSIQVITGGMPSGACAPLLQRLVTAPSLFGIPGVAALWLVLGLVMSFLLGSHGLWKSAICNRRQSDRRGSFRSAHRTYPSRDVWTVGRAWFPGRLRPSWLYGFSVSKSRRTLHSTLGGSRRCRRNAIVRRPGALLRYYGRRILVDCGAKYSHYDWPARIWQTDNLRSDCAYAIKSVQPKCRWDLTRLPAVYLIQSVAGS